MSAFSVVQLFATPWTVVRQAPSVLGIFQARILEWVAIPSPGDPTKPGIEAECLESSALGGRLFITALPGKQIIQSQMSIMSRDQKSQSMKQTEAML